MVLALIHAIRLYLQEQKAQGNSAITFVLEINIFIGMVLVKQPAISLLL